MNVPDTATVSTNTIKCIVNRCNLIHFIYQVTNLTSQPDIPTRNSDEGMQCMFDGERGNCPAVCCVMGRVIDIKNEI